MPNLSPFHVKACSLGAAVKISKVPATEMMRQSAANLQLLARSPRIAVDESQLLPGRLQVQLRWATEHRLFIKILPVNPELLHNGQAYDNHTVALPQSESETKKLANLSFGCRCRGSPWAVPSEAAFDRYTCAWLSCLYWFVACFYWHEPQCL